MVTKREIFQKPEIGLCDYSKYVNRQILQGIVLKSLPYKERDQIVTLFTPSHGLFKLFCKGSIKQTQAERALLSTLTEGEFSCAPGKQELARFYGGEILCQYVHLRQNYAQLDTALKLVEAILNSQWQGKGAPKLYSLFTYFLKQLNKVKDPTTLYTTFLLKTMIHEGNFHLPDKPSTVYRLGGEIVQESSNLLFEQEEEHLIRLLICNRAFEGLKEIELPSLFQRKIEKLFSHWVNG
ncbi:MAG: DNA repair protein RecO [Chlamydiia bacterium]|nr:DNA repair protein RecO [Chlamydiia bacterium]